MSTPTQHGENLAEQIQTHDAYGNFDPLGLADIWLILDNLHTHFMDNSHVQREQAMTMLESWMRQLESVDEELPPN